jgi:photosystem II stability/assembly factor-like uncharacterized protein
MKMFRNGFLLLSLSFLASTSYGQLYKQMMHDNSVNFYDVVEEGENYFATHGKGKGSGWKGYQRWKDDNEYKYYPSGDRSNVSPYFVSEQYEQFIANNPSPKNLYPNGWNELGPVSPGQITGHYAFGMGRVKCFYVDPSNIQTLYLGSRTGGFWKSEDGGTTWQGGSTDFLPATGVNTMHASPTNADSILINVNNSQNHYSHGLYRSVDGGDTWTQTNFNPGNLGWGGLGSNRKIYKVKYHPTVPNLIFIGTSVGMYRSDDNLTTWTSQLPSFEFTDIDFHPTDPNIMYAYAKDNANVVYVSGDAGVTWSTTSVPGSSGGVGTVAVSPVCPNCVYYMSNDGLWKSTDEGVSFTLVSTPGESDAGFAVSDIDDNNILAGYVDAFFSTDGGATFNQVTYWSLGNTNGAGNGHQNSYNTSTDYIHADLQAAECLNGVFYAVTDGFMVSSADGVSWNILSEDIGIRMNYNLGVSQSNHDRSIAGSQDNGTSMNTENGWVEAYGADGMECLIHPLNDDWMIGSWQYGGRIITKNAGQSVNTITPGGEDGYWIAPMMYDPNEQMRIYSMAENVYVSEDFGDNWTMVGSPTFSGDIKFATIAENNSNILVAARNEFIELSSDGGVTWSSIKNNLPNYSITDVVFDPNDDNTIVVTYGRYQVDNSKVWITHDQGATWTNITNNLGNMPVRSAVIDHTDASTIYLGTEIGVYKMPMGGNTWTLYNTALPNTSVREMEIMWGSNTLRATTWGRGLWEYAIDGRLDYPVILTTEITQQPTLNAPVELVDQYVTSTVDYDNTLTDVWVEWSVGAPTFGNVIPMSNTTGNEWVSDAPIPNQAVGTKVFFKVFAVGDANDTTETYKFQYTVHDFEYCDASGSNDGSNYHLSNFSLSNVNKPSGNETYTYWDQDTIYLVTGNNYTVTVQASTGWQSNDYAVWIDWNNDAVFSQDEEVMYMQDIGSNNAFVNFSIPPGATTYQPIRLRARVSYWGLSEPCGTTLGEVEDYPVFITGQASLTENENSRLLVYPNPTEGSLTIEGDDLDKGSLRILNGLGQECNVVAKVQDDNITLDISGLENGVYVLEIRSGNSVEQVKVIKR